MLGVSFHSPDRKTVPFGPYERVILARDLVQVQQEGWTDTLAYLDPGTCEWRVIGEVGELGPGAGPSRYFNDLSIFPWEE